MSLGSIKEILPAKVKNILRYERETHLKEIPNEIDLLHKTFGEDLLSVSFSPYRHPFFIVAKSESLQRLSISEIISIDKTHTKNGEGIYVLSEKISYDLIDKRKIKRCKGQRCIALVYIFTQNNDEHTLREIFGIIKLNVEKVACCTWMPKYFTIDFDKDKYFFIIYFIY